MTTGRNKGFSITLAIIILSSVLSMITEKVDEIGYVFEHGQEYTITVTGTAVDKTENAEDDIYQTLRIGIDFLNTGSVAASLRDYGLDLSCTYASSGNQRHCEWAFEREEASVNLPAGRTVTVWFVATVPKNYQDLSISFYASGNDEEYTTYYL